MRDLRLVRARDLVRVPWKDGGGTTAEVAIHPPGAGFADFAWRLSLADVARNGPFSFFPEIDRTLVLVEGRDLTLVVDGARHGLAARGDALSFPGEASVTSHLEAGPIRDLNVMTRRDRFRHTVRRTPLVDGPHEAGPVDIVVVVALEEGVEVAVRDRGCTLGRLDACVVEDNDDDPAIGGDALVIRLTAFR